MKNNFVNPVVAGVLNKFQTIYSRTTSFLNNESAVRGLIVSGDAGTGKTYWVRRALIDGGVSENVEYIKGSISPAALYVKLFLNREAGRIVVLDDCDIITQSSKDRNIIIEQLKAATGTDLDDRTISWQRATNNALMQENDVPGTFEFHGAVIWITNDTLDQISKKIAKTHWDAINTRFNSVKLYLTVEETVLYTLHLIDEGMLGDKCNAKEGGYSEEVIESTKEYLYNNWRNLDNVSPRAAIKLANDIMLYPNDWRVMVNS